MKYILILVSVFLACSPQKQEATLTNQQVIDKLVLFHDYFDQKDFKSMAALCTRDMKWFTLNGEQLSRDGMAGFFLPIMAQWERSLTQIEEPEIIFGSQIIVARYSSTIEINTPGGKTTMENLHTTVFKKTENGWKIWQHHMSKK